MKSVSRTVSGVLLLGLGGFILYTVATEAAPLWPTLWGIGWSVLLGGLGVYMFFNTKEDEIEEINDSEESDT